MQISTSVGVVHAILASSCSWNDRSIGSIAPGHKHHPLPRSAGACLPAGMSDIPPNPPKSPIVIVVLLAPGGSRAGERRLYYRSLVARTAPSRRGVLVRAFEEAGVIFADHQDPRAGGMS